MTRTTCPLTDFYRISYDHAYLVDVTPFLHALTSRRCGRGGEGAEELDANTQGVDSRMRQVRPVPPSNRSFHCAAFNQYLDRAYKQDAQAAK